MHRTRLKGTKEGPHMMALKTRTEPQFPPKRHVRSKGFITVAYGFADASGKGFGSTITVDGSLL
jgi:hypothetical protein